MTPREIIEGLSEYFKDRMDEEIDECYIGDALLCCADKEDLIQLLKGFYDV